MSWPELPYEAWRETRHTLHLYLQIIGKVRHTLSPKEHDWGHAPLYLTARGLTTSPIPHRNGVFDIVVDLIDHYVAVRKPTGEIHRLDLAPRTVADFYSGLMGILDSTGLPVEIAAEPSDVRDGIPFAEDTVHASYEKRWANRFFLVLLEVDRVLKEHRARFRGRVSPVQLWWGSLDLAYTRAVGDEQSAGGFWPGNEEFPHAAFYTYFLPKPDGIEAAATEPEGAFWSTELGEFLLPYDCVRASTDPRAALLAFLDSTYRAGAERAGWEAALTA